MEVALPDKSLLVPLLSVCPRPWNANKLCESLPVSLVRPRHSFKTENLKRRAAAQVGSGVPFSEYPITWP